MTHEQWFTAVTTAVLPGWLLLGLAPRWKWTRYIIHAVFIPLGLAVVYTAFILKGFTGGALGGFGSLAEVMLLLQTKDIALAGWVHYLAFDLFIGAWEVRDSQSAGLPHWLVVPCLVLTFLAGPSGLGLYLAFRWVWKRRIALT